MGFSAEGDVSDDFGLLPEKRYKLALIKFEKKDGQNEGVRYLNCQINVVEGEYKKRVLFHMFCLEHPNEEVVERAEKDLRRMMISAGVKNLDSKWDLTPLVGKPLIARVGTIESKNKEYDDKSGIRNFVIDNNTSTSSGNKDDKKQIKKLIKQLTKSLPDLKKKKAKKVKAEIKELEAKLKVSSEMPSEMLPDDVPF